MAKTILDGDLVNPLEKSFGVGVTPGTARLNIRSPNNIVEIVAQFGNLQQIGALNIFTDSNTEWGFGTLNSRNMLFKTNQIERMRIAADGAILVGKTTVTANAGDIQLSKGLSFPATQVACSDPNTLDDYEEGTFTPTVVGVTTAGTGTYSQQAGRYTKIGNRVFFTVKLSWTAHTGVGDMRVGALPFTSNSTATNESAVSLRVNNITLAASSVMQGYIGANSTQITLDQYPAGGGATTAVSLDTSATLIITGHYDI